MNRILNIQTLKPLLAATVLSLPLLALPAQAEGDGKWRGGENVYEKVCGHCHDVGIGPQIKGRQLPPAYITTIVRHGFRAMPAFPASFIDDASLQAVGEYIQSSPAPAQQASGAEQ
jgi:mono/diheme cytochrome c family protein